MASVFPYTLVAGTCGNQSFVYATGGIPAVITGATFDCKVRAETSNTTIILDFDLLFTITDASVGEFDLFIPSLTTEPYQVEGLEAVWDAAIILASGERKPLWIESPFELTARGSRD